VYNKPISGPLGSTSAEGKGMSASPLTALREQARNGGRGSVAVPRAKRWSVVVNPQRNARRGDAVEMAENIANGRNMSERPVSEWMARTGYAARGKSGLVGG